MILTVQDKKTGEDKDSVLKNILKSQKGINDEFLGFIFSYKYAKVVSSTRSQLNMINPNTGRCHTVYKQLGAAFWKNVLWFSTQPIQI